MASSKRGFTVMRWLRRLWTRRDRASAPLGESERGGQASPPGACVEPAPAPRDVDAEVRRLMRRLAKVSRNTRPGPDPDDPPPAAAAAMRATG